MIRMAALSLVAILGLACAYHQPDSTAPSVAVGMPAHLGISVDVGSGGFAGIAVRVTDVNNRSISGVIVTVTTSAGELHPSSAVSDAGGTVLVTLTTPTVATITVMAGTISATTTVTP